MLALPQVTTIMANSKQNREKRLTMRERAELQVVTHFPNVGEQWLWSRKRSDGFTTLPRTMPIVMQAIDSLTKGEAAGHTYYCLWCRAPDHAFLPIESPATFAAEAGFSGERAVDTWRRRMKALRQLHFIDSKPGPSGEFHYVLIYNPNLVLEWLHYKKQLPDGIYGRFHDRVLEIGAYSEIAQMRTFLAAHPEAPVPGTPAQPAEAAPIEELTLAELEEAETTTKRRKKK